MSDVETVFVGRVGSSRDAALPELSVVRLTVAARAWDGTVLPVGSVGTVVSVLSDGAAYDVEFTDPVALATIEGTALARRP